MLGGVIASMALVLVLVMNQVGVTVDGKSKTCTNSEFSTAGCIMGITRCTHRRCRSRSDSMNLTMSRNNGLIAADECIDLSKRF